MGSAAATPMLQQVLAAVRDAGRQIEAIRRQGVTVADKADASPVTEADHAADAALKDRLRAVEPAAWLSEETQDSAARLGATRLWIVDPLDGTKEFIQGLPEYTVAVAFVVAGDPVLGVVHNPATEDTYWAERGRGAFRNGAKIGIAEGSSLLASRSEMKRGEFDGFGNWDLVSIGSIEYKLALVACGEGAATLARGPKWEWDVCAGALIVREAGGVVTDAFGGPLRFNQPFPKVKGIIAGAPAAYRRVLEQVRETGASDRMDEFTDLPGGYST